MRVYAPAWFFIKKYPSCTKGPQHLWRLMKFSRYLDRRLKKIVDPVIWRNAYFCHPENLLLAMINDDRLEIHREHLAGEEF